MLWDSNSYKIWGFQGDVQVASSGSWHWYHKSEDNLDDKPLSFPHVLIITLPVSMSTESNVAVKVECARAVLLKKLCK